VYSGIIPKEDYTINAMDAVFVSKDLFIKQDFGTFPSRTNDREIPYLTRITHIHAYHHIYNIIMQLNVATNIRL
jgi:hypothetical protein